jgi:hypothetical protein
VLGNLDEAYHMSGNQNADISAEDFRKESLKINVPEIKKALQRRFRNEHIARLGNQHIIYPALGRSDFEKIIKRELRKIALKAIDHFGIRLRFHSSLHQLLFSEGVYPTQGTRPLLTTIYQFVQSRLGNVLYEMHTHQLTNCDVQFEAHSQGILARFLRKEETIHTRLFEQAFELKKLRREKRDDLQAITAVHESGHAILYTLLLGEVPKVVFSVTSDTRSHGFTQRDDQTEYMVKQDIIPHMAVLLGGLIAEKIVFGEEKVTDGNSDDINRATKIATQSLKSEGMGSFIANFSVESPQTNLRLFDTDGSLNHEARILLSSAATLAEETLKKQKSLLLHMADYLSDHGHLHKADIIKIIEEHVRDFDVESIKNKGNDMTYRRKLKEEVFKQTKRLTIEASEKIELVPSQNGQLRN